MTPLEIQQRIDEFTLRTEDQAPRPYLGASEIGEKCLRKLWYKFRWCGGEKFDGRMLRLFRRGDQQENEFVEMLRGAGFLVEMPTPKDEARFKFKDCEGHFAGTCDGALSPSLEAAVADFEWYLAEFKSYNKKNFADLKKSGVKENDPKYYSQMQTYMGELGFEKALFCAVCKDDDDLYFEWIPYDEDHFHICLNKAETVINAQTPPPRISNDAKSFTCRYCHFNRICYENEPIPPASRHCRNCSHGSPAQAGTWVCAKGHTFGTLCQDYSPVAGG